MVFDRPIRSIVRAGTYRLFSSISAMAYMTLLVVFMGSEALAALAAAILLIDLSYKTAITYLWDRLWNRIKWGRIPMAFPGACVWLTGLPASGKTTIAKELARRLDEMLVPCGRLDGDVSRGTYCSDLRFSKEDRDENIRRNSYVASYLSHNNKIAICAFVSPYEEARAHVRARCKNFIEVYVNCPLPVCEARDKERGSTLYERARNGQTKGVTGIDDPYEAPKAADLVLDTETTSIDDSVGIVLAELERRGLLAGSR